MKSGVIVRSEIRRRRTGFGEKCGGFRRESLTINIFDIASGCRTFFANRGGNVQREKNSKMI